MFCIGWNRKKKISPKLGETVAVGFPVGRTDGLTSIHIGGSYTFLDTNERNALVTLLSGENYCKHSWYQLNLPTAYFSGQRQINCVCEKCGKTKWEHYK